MQDPIVNRVAASGLLTFNLEHHYPEGERVVLDIADGLFKGLVLKEKDFRSWVKDLNVEQFRNCHVAVCCSSDAIVPTWAYMLVTSHLSEIASTVVFGDLQTLETVLWEQALSRLDLSPYQAQKMVIKGCGDLDVGPAAYTAITRLLRPVASSIMYGEACSTVPVFKKKS
jgi:hypothetical protein